MKTRRIAVSLVVCIALLVALALCVGLCGCSAKTVVKRLEKAMEKSFAQDNVQMDTTVSVAVKNGNTSQTSTSESTIMLQQRGYYTPWLKLQDNGNELYVVGKDVYIGSSGRSVSTREAGISFDNDDMVGSFQNQSVMPQVPAQLNYLAAFDFRGTHASYRFEFDSASLNQLLEEGLLSQQLLDQLKKESKELTITSMSTEITVENGLIEREKVHMEYRLTQYWNDADYVVDAITEFSYPSAAALPEKVATQYELKTHIRPYCTDIEEVYAQVLANDRRTTSSGMKVVQYNVERAASDDRYLVIKNGMDVEVYSLPFMIHTHTMHCDLSVQASMLSDHRLLLTPSGNAFEGYEIYDLESMTLCFKSQDKPIATRGDYAFVIKWVELEPEFVNSHEYAVVIERVSMTSGERIEVCRGDRITSYSNYESFNSNHRDFTTYVDSRHGDLLVEVYGKNYFCRLTGEFLRQDSDPISGSFVLSDGKLWLNSRKTVFDFSTGAKIGDYDYPFESCDLVADGENVQLLRALTGTEYSFYLYDKTTGDARLLKDLLTARTIRFIADDIILRAESNYLQICFLPERS